MLSYIVPNYLLYRLKLFRTRLAEVLNNVLQDEEQVALAELLPLINAGLKTTTLFGTIEATAACEKMSELNEIMLSEGVVYKI